MGFSPKTWRPSLETIVSSLLGTRPYLLTRKVMPRNREPRINAITVNVVRALTASGGLKAGTPSDMASVPVRAVEPEEKARSTRSKLKPCVAAICVSGGAQCMSDPGASPMSTLTMPVMIRATIAAMKK